MNTIDGKTLQEVLKLQRQRLDRLRSVKRESERERPLLIKAKEGSTPAGGEYDLYDWMFYGDVWHKLEYPIYTRAILRNEIVLDPDSNNYQYIKEGIEKIKAYCDKHNIPYEMYYSGGKGIHFHIFFSANLNIEEHFDKAKALDVDVFKIVRETLVRGILKRAGADPEKMGIDWKKIRFDVHSQGSMVRECGTLRSNGKYKTLIDEVHNNIPDYLPLKFPEEAPQLWDFSNTEYAESVKIAIAAEIERVERNNEYNLDNLDFVGTDLMRFPCMKNLVSIDPGEGKRYYAAVSATLLGRKCGCTKEQIEQFVSSLLHGFKGLTQEQCTIRLVNSLKILDSDRHFSCRVFKESVDSKYCDYWNCPLSEKISNNVKNNILGKIKSMDVPELSTDRMDMVWDLVTKDVLRLKKEYRSALIRHEIRKHFKLKTDEVNDILKRLIIRERDTAGIGHYFTAEGKFIPGRLAGDIEKLAYIATMSDTNQIWLYNDETGCYGPNGESFIRKSVQDILKDESIQKRGDEVVYAISLDTLIDRAEFDKDNECINLQNGYYNIYTQEFFPHSPDKYFTSALPFKYDPKAGCPHFNKFIKTTGVNPVIIYEIFAYCLVSGYPIQQLIFLIGDGGNGKGTLMRVLTQYLGAEYVSGYSIQSLAEDRYATSYLYGKRANLCGDMSFKSVNDVSVVKSITGGDRIPARSPYGKPFSFVNSAKLVFSMNHMPEFDDSTDSFCRRPVIIEFNRLVRGLDPNFKEDILHTPEELSGIFNEAIKVLHELLKRGEFTGTKSIEENREYISRKSNPIGTFINGCTYLNEYESTPTTEVYAGYVKWCRENHETALTEEHFGRQIVSKFPEIKRIRVRVSGERIYKYKGIELDKDYSGLDLLAQLDQYEEARTSVPSKPSCVPSMSLVKKSDFTISVDENEAIVPSKIPIFNENNPGKKDDEKDNSKDIESNMGCLPGTGDKNCSIDIDSHCEFTGDALGTVLGTPYQCIECGSPKVLHKSELLNREIVYRCQSCWEKYQRLSPVKLPEMEVL